VVDCVLNGYSHRSGNTALDQVVLALEVMYDIRTGVDLSQLMSLCQFASRIFGAPIPPWLPTLGHTRTLMAGSHRRDPAGGLVHLGRFESRNHRAASASRLDTTALERHGMAGPVALKIQTMGFQFDEKQLQEVFEKLRRVMAQKKFATNEELEAVVHEVLGK